MYYNIIKYSADSKGVHFMEGKGHFIKEELRAKLRKRKEDQNKERLKEERFQVENKVGRGREVEMDENNQRL